MPLSGGGNKWTDHVRAFATKNKVSYMCAMSNPQCSATYKGRKVKPTKEQKKAKKENITMAMEDIPAPARGEAFSDIFESTTPIEGSTPPNVRALLKNKGSLSRALEKKRKDQEGMTAEDINIAKPDTKGKAKKSGRPAKYATAEEARQAKIANTIRRAKERVGEKKDTKMVARIARAKKEWEDWASGLEEPRGNMYGDGKGERRENEIIVERVERAKKRFPSLKISDWYRPINVIKDTKFNQNKQTISLPAELTTLSGKGVSFDVGMSGGMFKSWIDTAKAIIGRNPQLTKEQAEQAERFADGLMADPRGITFEGVSRVPIDLRKELAEEFYNRATMGREDKDAIGTIGDTFADEVRKQFEAQKGKGVVGGRRKKKAFGFNDFVQGLNKVNPVMWGIQNHPEVGIKLGQVTNDNLLPAVVAVGKPVYDATAIATATTLTGNPLLGKVVADEFWNAYGKPYDPRDRQDNEALKQISERVGKEAGKEASKAGKGRKKGGATPPPPPKKRRCSPPDRRQENPQPVMPVMPMPMPMPMPQLPPPPNMFRPIYRDDNIVPPNIPITPIIRPVPRPRGGANALQKGQSAEMRTYLKPPLTYNLNEIIHSNDAPLSKYGSTANRYRDFSNSFDPKAQKQIDKAINTLITNGVIPAPPVYMKASAPVFVPKSGKGLYGGLGGDPSTYTPAYLNRPRLGADPRTYTPAYLSQGGARDVLGDFISLIVRELKGGLYGGADEPPPPPPPPTPEEEEFVEEDPMAGIDWLAIGQALMQEANQEADDDLNITQAGSRC